jgi:hypothetical protein
VVAAARHFSLISSSEVCAEIGRNSAFYDPNVVPHSKRSRSQRTSKIFPTTSAGTPEDVLPSISEGIRQSFITRFRKLIEASDIPHSIRSTSQRTANKSPIQREALLKEPQNKKAPFFSGAPHNLREFVCKNCSEVTILWYVANTV